MVQTTKSPSERLRELFETADCQIASNCDPFSRPITTPYQHANVPL